MKARHFAPVAPLHVLPAGPYATPGDCADALADALRGVALGGYDDLICACLVRQLDLPTLRVIVSLMERIREAGNLEAVDAENTLRARHAQPPRHHVDRGVAPIPQQHGGHSHYGVPGIPGNAGPGF